MTNLLNHIKTINTNSRQQMAQNPGWYIGMLSEDPKHWSDMGILTVEDYERYELETYIYDAHKTAFGVKGRHYKFSEMTLEELKAEADYISKACDQAMAEEEQAEKEAKAKFEERVSDMIQTGAKDRETAIRWILQAEGLEGEKDAGYICYSLGLSYDDEKMFQNLGA